VYGQGRQLCTFSLSNTRTQQVQQWQHRWVLLRASRGLKFEVQHRILLHQCSSCNEAMVVNY
jgi:hypothetical protein